MIRDRIGIFDLFVKKFFRGNQKKLQRNGNTIVTFHFVQNIFEFSMLLLTAILAKTPCGQAISKENKVTKDNTVQCT